MDHVWFADGGDVDQRPDRLRILLPGLILYQWRSRKTSGGSGWFGGGHGSGRSRYS